MARQNLLSEFGQHVGRVRVAGGRQTPKLLEIFLLSCEFNQLILSVPAAGGRQTPKLFEVFPLSGKLDEFAYCVIVPMGGPLPEC